MMMKIENNKSMQQTTSSHITHYPRIKLGFTWLALIPISAWAVSTIYIPLSSENLSRVTNWTATLTILLLMGLSVLFHVVAHLVAARITHNQTPDTLTIFLFGDAAQGWPGAASNWQEMLIAVAGPFINILLSGLAYLLWNAQINVFLNLIALFACIFNVWLFLINLLPAFPLDGGRVLKASLQDMLASRSSLAVLIRRFGIFFVLALAGWGIFLYLQNSRFQSTNRVDHICAGDSVGRWSADTTGPAGCSGISPWTELKTSLAARFGHGSARSHNARRFLLHLADGQRFGRARSCALRGTDGEPPGPISPRAQGHFSSDYRLYARADPRG